MKVAVYSLVLVMISMTAYADDIFNDRELKTIRVIEASKDQAAAWITDFDGNEAQLSIAMRVPPSLQWITPQLLSRLTIEG